MPPHAQALADAVIARRGQLRISQRELARLAGITLDSVQAIEKATRTQIRAGTKAALDDGLKWQPGTADHLFRAGRMPEKKPESRLRIATKTPVTREDIAAMTREEMLWVADLIHAVTGSMDHVAAWVNGVERVKMEENQRKHGQTS
jgi:DNA-binding transcriptional regulator YiaG